MKITLPQQVAGARDALFVLEVEFPVATAERTVTVETSGPIEALDLRGSGPGGAYQIPMGLERLHVPMRVVETGMGTASVRVRCTGGPEMGAEEERTIRLGAPPASSAGAGAGSKVAVALVLLALLGTAALWIYPRVMGGPSVPDVRGMTESQARQKLQVAEYLVVVRQEETSDVTLHERALRTNPAASEHLAKGSEVELIMGQPQGRLLTVPALRGQMEGPAVAALEAEGFAYDINYDYEEASLAAGTVTRQSPQEDQRVERGTVIELWVAARRTSAPAPGPDMPGPDMPGPDVPGPDMPGPDVPGPDVPGPDMPGPDVPGPDVPGPDMPGPDVPGPDMPGPDMPGPDMPGPDMPGPDMPGPDVPGPDVPQPDLPKPDVPKPDVPKPEVPQAPQGMVSVPDLSGLTERQARDALEELRLMALPDEVEVADAAQRGTVVRQMPSPGTHVWPATQVFVSIGRTPSSRTVPKPDVPKPDVPKPDVPKPDVPKPDVPTVPSPANPLPTVATAQARLVPDVIGLSRDKATGDLKMAGLRYRLNLEETPDVPDGQVLSQDPPAGSSQPEGSMITLTIAQAPAAQGVQVPDIVGRPRAEAERILRGENFLVRATLGGAPDAQREKVVAQSPAGGTRRPSRTWVEIVVGQPGLPVRTPQGGPPPPLGFEGPLAPAPITGSTGAELQAPGTSAGQLVPGAGTPRGVAPVPPVPLPARDAPPTAVVPGVKNQDVQAAIQAVLEAGLLPILMMDRDTPQVAAGHVVHQNPPAGSPALPGDLMRLSVHIPSNTTERNVDLPSAVGMLIERAQQMFAARGVRVRVLEISSPLHPYARSGRVAASYPVSLVPRSIGETVTLWVVK